MKNISLYFFFPLSVHHIHFFSYENQTTHKHEIKTKTEIPHKWILSNLQIFVLIAFRKNNFLPVDYKTHTNSNSYSHYYCHLIPKKISLYLASICFQILFALRLFVSIFCFTLLCSFLNYYYPFFCLRFCLQTKQIPCLFIYLTYHNPPAAKKCRKLKKKNENHRRKHSFYQSSHTTTG